MRAIVYKIHGQLGVAYLEGEGRGYVGECIIKNGEVAVIPQSVREIEGVSETELDYSDDPTAQDVIDRMILRVRRLRDRLEEFENDDVEAGDPRELILQAIACRDELNLMIQRFTLGRL